MNPTLVELLRRNVVILSLAINNLRINKAKELLATSNLKTFEISEAVGIHDPAYFSVLFKKNTGMSPKAYRDQFVNV